MKAKKIWIATHPKDPDSVEMSCRNQQGDYAHVFSHETQTEEYVPYKEYVAIEVEG